MGLLSVLESFARRTVDMTNKKQRGRLGESSHCTFASDWVHDTYVGDICELHDKDYDRGGTEKDRKRADERFEERLRERGIEVNKPKELGRIADLFYRMVRLFGWSRFNYRK